MIHTHIARVSAIVSVLAVACLAALARLAAAQSVGTAITYQGQLQRSGSPANGMCDFQFSLWGASMAGTRVVPTQAIHAVPVTNGLFTVALDFGNEFKGNARWLESAVRCSGDADFTTLTPRQQLTAAPYALTLRPGAVILGALPDTALLNVNNDSQGIGVYGGATAGDGLFGFTFAAHTFSIAGVHGLSHGDGGVGVFGEANFGNAFGVYGKSDSGVGVYGSTSAAHTTATAGVNGVSSGDSGIGVIGEANVGNSWGVYGKSASGLGVYGTSDSGEGVRGYTATGKRGVFGQSDAPNASGVEGFADNGANSAGVFGRSNNGVGVWGRNSSGIAMFAEGNATQTRGSGGWVKAMALINQDGSIARCYNGITGSSSGDCGFSSSLKDITFDGTPVDPYVNFGFRVDDRYVLAIPAVQLPGDNISSRRRSVL